MPGLVQPLLGRGPLDPTEVFQGPWRSLEAFAILPGKVWDFDDPTQEAGIYVTGGHGTVDLEGRAVDLPGGTALTFVKGSRGTVTAGPDGMELFVVLLHADPDAAGPAPAEA